MKQTNSDSFLTFFSCPTCLFTVTIVISSEQINAYIVSMFFVDTKY